jgi:hypothetical protein
VTLEEFNETYKGTDPVKCAMDIFKSKELQKLGFKNSKNGDDIEHVNSEVDLNDPYDQFGHGIQAYFRMMRTLIIVFVGITIIFVPVMILYY